MDGGLRDDCYSTIDTSFAAIALALGASLVDVVYSAQERRCNIILDLSAIDPKSASKRLHGVADRIGMMDCPIDPTDLKVRLNDSAVHVAFARLSDLRELIRARKPRQERV